MSKKNKNKGTKIKRRTDAQNSASSSPRPSVTASSASPPIELSFRIIAILYLILSLGYDILNPIFEGPDEHHHYFTTEWIARNWRLPAVPQPVEPRGFVTEIEDEAGFLGQEAAQPPLYYLLTAPLIAPFDLSQSKTWTVFNRFAALGDASLPANRNGFIHSDAERWPGQLGHFRAIYLLRHLSTLIGLGTIYLIYRAGQQLFPDQPNIPLRAAFLVAVLPQFTFQHSLVSNDVLITLLVSLALFLLIIYTQQHDDLRVTSDEPDLSQAFVTRLSSFAANSRVLLILGTVIGLAILTKNQGTVLLIYAVGFLGLRGLRAGQRWAVIGRTVATVTLPALLIGGWLWIRNIILYGDWSAANQFVILAGGPRDASLFQVLSEAPSIWRSFIAVFGWLTVTPRDEVYWVWSLVVGVALIGLIWGWNSRVTEGPNNGMTDGRSDKVTKRQSDRMTETRSFRYSVIQVIRHSELTTLPILLFGWVLAVYLSLIAFMLQTEAAQGRLLFPAILPLALGISYGIEVIASRLQLWNRVQEYGLYLLWGLNLSLLLVVLWPAYWRAQIVTGDQFRRGGFTLNERWQEQAIVYQDSLLYTETVRPGDWVEVDIFWSAGQLDPLNPAELVLELFGIDNQLLGKWQGVHARGLGLHPANYADREPERRTSILWESGYVQVDEPKNEQRIDLPVQAILIARSSDTDESNEIGRVKIIPESWPALSEEPLAEIGNGIELLSTEIIEIEEGKQIEILVEWQVTQDQSVDLTTFVHLGQPGEAPLAQGDSIPRQGFYPTSLWRAGERFTDSYTLIIPDDLPSGSYPLQIGMYDSASSTFIRYPLLVNGVRQEGEAFVMGDVVR